MRKTVMLLVSTAVLVALVAGAALAAAPTGAIKMVELRGKNYQKIQCPQTLPCIASGNNDLVYERKGNGKRDRILLKGGSDQVRANTYIRDKDVIKGGPGFDLIYTDDGDKRDRIYGGKGRDKCYVDAKSEAIRGCSKVIVVRP
jgi:hypothetical protein